MPRKQDEVGKIKGKEKRGGRGGNRHRPKRGGEKTGLKLWIKQTKKTTKNKKQKNPSSIWGFKADQLDKMQLPFTL